MDETRTYAVSVVLDVRATSASAAQMHVADALCELPLALLGNDEGIDSYFVGDAVEIQKEQR